MPNHIYPYLALSTPIYAIELSGTDTDRTAIAEVAYSGKMEGILTLKTLTGLPVPSYMTDGLVV